MSPENYGFGLRATKTGWIVVSGDHKKPRTSALKRHVKHQLVRFPGIACFNRLPPGTPQEH